MTLLPIVDRELRVASRRRATYSSRVMVALITAVLALWMMLTLPPVVSTTVAGASLFRRLSWAAVVAALISGPAATAGCLRSEKRPGTLGILERIGRDLCACTRGILAFDHFNICALDGSAADRIARGDPRLGGPPAAHWPVWLAL